MCAYQMLDAKSKCASALIRGICDSFQIVVGIDEQTGQRQYAPNPKSLNPFQKAGEFFDSDFMERLFGHRIDGRTANMLAKEWATNGCQRGEKGEVYAKIIFNTILDINDKKVTTTDGKGRQVIKPLIYTTFDNGLRFYRPSEMASFFGKQFIDEDNPDVGMGGEEALALAIEFYKEFIGNNETQEQESQETATKPKVGRPSKKTENEERKETI